MLPIEILLLQEDSTAHNYQKGLANKKLERKKQIERRKKVAVCLTSITNHLDSRSVHEFNMI